MSVEEVLISVATLEGRWEDFGWLYGLFLYGQSLKRDEFHRELSFIVVYRGLTGANQMRDARKSLDEMLAYAAPVRRQLHFIPTLSIIDKIQAEDPGVHAVLGHAVPIFVR